MAHSNAQLLLLQGNCKRDPESYHADFAMQRSHFYAQLELFSIKPDQKAPELSNLVAFLAHVSKCYPDDLASFPKELMGLISKHAAVLQPQLRISIVQALILMRHKGVVAAEELLPVCFQLFQCQDKALRTLLHSFIIKDIAAFNTAGRNDRLNRVVQNYLYKLIENDREPVVKRSLAVLTELWRRQIWRDARTVNVIASATIHESANIMLAACKFFLGQDIPKEDDEEGSDTEAPAGPTRDDVYRAYHKGTPSTKKKKIRKLKRVMGTVEKSKKKAAANVQDSFAALQLLHDPQTFAERLFSRCQQKNARFETRLIMLQVVSRAIGVHELILENFYPFIQRYVQPNQRDIVTVLAVLVQACHHLVPPDLLRPVMKQLVDQFVHDKARPEVVTVGLKTVREICVRCPLVMDEDLLSDLVLYKQERDKHVKNAAKALVSLFRELKPSMLEKKNRGRGADLALELKQFGAADFKERIEGAALLQEAEEKGLNSSDDDDDDDDDRDDMGKGLNAGGDAAGVLLSADADEQSSDGEGDELPDADAGSDEDGVDDAAEDGEADGSEQDTVPAAKVDGGTARSPRGRKRAQPDGGFDDAEGSECEDGDAEDDEEDDSDEDVILGGSDEEEEDDDGGSRAAARKGRAVEEKGAAGADTLAQLRKRLASAGAGRQAGEASTSGRDTSAAVPLEYERILTQDDFERIRKLKIKKMVEDAMQKHGLKSAAQRAMLKHKLYEDMEEALDEQEAQEAAVQQRLDPRSLLSKRRGKADKAERMASVMAGREGREQFGSSISRKKTKTGGTSNRQKEKGKFVLLGAMKSQAANRKRKQKHKNNPKHFRGRASLGAWDKK